MIRDDGVTGMVRLEQLSKVELFRDLSRRELREVEEHLHTRVYEKDETVYEEGDIGHGIFAVISGKVRANMRASAVDAGSIEFGPGELLGELCLFEEATRTATAVAVERTVTTALFRAELLTIVEKDKNIGVKVLFQLAQILSRRARYVWLNQGHLPSL